MYIRKVRPSAKKNPCFVSWLLNFHFEDLSSIVLSIWSDFGNLTSYIIPINCESPVEKITNLNLIIISYLIWILLIKVTQSQNRRKILDLILKFVLIFNWELIRTVCSTTLHKDKFWQQFVYFLTFSLFPINLNDLH